MSFWTKNNRNNQSKIRTTKSMDHWERGELSSLDSHTLDRQKGSADFGMVFEAFWCMVGIMLASFWDNCRIIVASCWHHFGIIFASTFRRRFRKRFGSILGSIWGSFWAHFWPKNPISLGCLSSDPNFLPQYHRQPTRKTFSLEVELPYKYRFYRRLFPLSWSTEARNLVTSTFFSKMTKPGSPGGGGVDFEPKIVFWGFGPVKLLCWCSYSVSIIGKNFLIFLKIFPNLGLHLSAQIKNLRSQKE